MSLESNPQRVDLSNLSTSVAQIKEVLSTIIVGQQQMLDLVIAGILANGHILIEGVPGVAKTLTAKLLAKSLDANFSRIQFTPDIMPSDVLGTSIFNPQQQTFEFRPGPIFGNIILVDEINRAPAKTQSALFEVMEERQITMDGKTYQMEEPFIVLATQNPIEHEGTYRLPEAQLDRFLLKIEVNYPTLEEETQILVHQHSQTIQSQLEQVKAVISAEQIKFYRQQIKEIHVEEKLLQFVATITHATRNTKSLYLGASPRASLAIINVAKAIAAMKGRDFVTPDDIIEVAPSVLRHRIMLSPETEMEGISNDEIISQLIRKIEIPR